MTDADIYPVPTDWAKDARVDAETYAQMYGRGLADPGSFWLEQAKRLDWIKRPEIAGDWSFDEQDFHISWFRDGMLNVAANCLVRHMAKNDENVALTQEPDDTAAAPRHLTQPPIPHQERRFANE